MYTPPVQQSYEPPVQQSYEPPVQQSYEPPVQQSYEPPVQQSYEPPVQQSYEPPVQQSYEPPVQQSYEPPKQKQPASGGYVPPTGGGKPPVKDGGQKKGGGSKVAIIIIALVVLAALAVTAVVFIVRGLSGKKDAPGAGRYECVSYTALGVELESDGEWMELKPNGKATVFLQGEEYSGKWELDGKNFTLHQAGDTFEGTLEDGTLEVDFGGVVYLFAMEGAAPSGGNAAAGRYECISCEVDGQEASPDGEWIRLEKNGDAVLYFMGDEFEGTWQLNGTRFVLTQNGDKFKGTLENGLLKLDIAGMVYRFAGKNYQAPDIGPAETETPETEAPVEPETEAPAVSSEYAWWDGDFYGWWVVKQPEEDWQNGEFNFWDVCATIDVNADGTGYIELWDTDCEPDKVFAQVDVYFGSGTTEYGAMMSEDGYLYDHHIGHADWIIDMGVSNSSGLDQMMCIDGTYVDPEDSSTAFDYLIFLRPWGMSWDDVAVAPSEDLFFDNMMPAHYDDWYLPRMDDPMPDYFEGIVFD